MASLARVAAAVFVVVAVVAAFVLAAAGVAGDGDGTSGGEGFDWLKATNGRGEFRDGFATADAALAAGFVATGINAQTITLTITGGAGGAYNAVLRGGRYYSNEENPDTSADIPASAEVFGSDGRRLFAAKGYKFMEARQEEDAIVIRHWRGTMGCGLTDYRLLPAGENLTIAKAESISTKDNSPCKTQ